MWQILRLGPQALWSALARGESEIIVSQDVCHDGLDLLGSKEAPWTCVPPVPKAILFQPGTE